MTRLPSVSLILAASIAVAAAAQTAGSPGAGQPQRRRADRVATPVYAVPRAPAGMNERETWIPELRNAFAIPMLRYRTSRMVFKNEADAATLGTPASESPAVAVR